MNLTFRSFAPLFLTIWLFAGCHRAKPALGFGDEWRSLTLRERQMYVSAYLDGNSNGTLSLCNDLEDHLVVLKLSKDVVATDRPCLQFRHQYSHINPEAHLTFDYVNPYIAVIDDFYKHSDCRIMPYVVLMDHLDDAEYKSGEELYKYVRSADARWGAFSGFDGMENCYNADRKDP